MATLLPLLLLTHGKDPFLWDLVLLAGMLASHHNIFANVGLDFRVGLDVLIIRLHAQARQLLLYSISTEFVPVRHDHCYVERAVVTIY